MRMHLSCWAPINCLHNNNNLFFIYIFGRLQNVLACWLVLALDGAASPVATYQSYQTGESGKRRMAWSNAIALRQLHTTFIFTNSVCTADEHFAPKHILLLGNTLLLKNITHFAAQHTLQNHNLLFNTSCS